ncbi:MAG: YabP/YqfC family sporulation protein [Clostridia bacterium]|nr:YabP/YqfC family sporulation protein [Clostridia bacterium]
MTDKDRRNKRNSIGIPSGLSSFHLEANRSVKGMAIVLSGIIGVSDFSDQEVVLLSHSGRVFVKGKKLFINVFENNTVEIVGRVEGIIFSYGNSR